MKACIIQPPYSRDTSFSDEYFVFKIRMLDECTEEVDIIVLPEYSEEFTGLKIVKFEDILKKFACHVIMNVHIKPLSMDEPYPEDAMKKIVTLINKYDCAGYVYLMLETDYQIRQFNEYAPYLSVCVGHLSVRPWDIVDRAIEHGCEKVQLFKPYYNKEMVIKAHRNGIKCNVFWSDTEEETKEFLELGIDTILTNDYNRIS